MALRTPLTVSPYLYLGDSTGLPLDYGAVYFGEPDKDPEFYPIDIFTNDELTKPASQPVRTKGGFLNINGDMVEIHAKETIYSVKVLDQYGRKIMYKGRAMRDSWNDDVIERVDEAIVNTQINATQVSAKIAADAVAAAIDGVAVDANIINDALVTTVPKTGTAISRTQRAINSEIVSVKDFGAKGDGIADDTAAIQAAINYAAAILVNAPIGINTATAAVIIPAGIYKLTSTLNLKTSVQINGSGSGSTLILVNHNGVGIQAPELTGSWYANIHLTGFKITNKGTGAIGNDAIYQCNTIRNCYMFDVIADGFHNSFSFKNTWTHKIEQCCSYNVKNSHIYAGATVGGLHVYGGRYDIADGHGVYVNSATAELIMNDVTVQSGKRSAVRVDNCYTTELHQCFFEGNCIDSATDYHVYIKPTSTVSLSSASVTNSVINNSSQSNRDGLGVLYVDNVRSFTYKERWTRNGINSLPIVGELVVQTDIQVNNSGSRTNMLTNIKPNASATAFVKQTSRPTGIYGRDMAEVSFSPLTYAALNIGTQSIGVAVGTHNYKGTVQGYGADFALKINPADGDVFIGKTSEAFIAAGTNEFSGRFKATTQATSSNLTPNTTTGFVVINATSGARTVDLANISADYGRTMTIAKTDATANIVVVKAKAGQTVNGAASYNIGSKGVLQLIGEDGNWLVI